MSQSVKALTQEEIHKVLKVAAENRRNHAIILLGLKHGMRASEISNLELKDVDLKNGEITIRRLKGSLKTTQPLSDVSGQPLLSENRVLRAWLEERGNHPSPRVFISQKSGRLHRSQLHRIFADIAERAGLPQDKRHIHVLKHSLGVSLVEANVNLAVIKQALGHKSIASTAVYTVPSDETAGKAITATFANMF
jgi:site-specific recombinase XerD